MSHNDIVKSLLEYLEESNCTLISLDLSVRLPYALIQDDEGDKFDINFYEEHNTWLSLHPSINEVIEALDKFRDIVGDEKITFRSIFVDDYYDIRINVAGKPLYSYDRVNKRWNI